jgi:hypothetical protein
LELSRDFYFDILELSLDFAFHKVVGLVMRLETNNVRASSSHGIFQLMVIKIVIVNIRLSLVASNRSGSVVIDCCQNSLGFLCSSFLIRRIFFSRRVSKKLIFDYQSSSIHKISDR